MATREEKKANAEEAYAWVEAYVDAGFTREETIKIMVAWNGRPETVQPSPDMEEMMSKTRRIVERTLREMEDN